MNEINNCIYVDYRKYIWKFSLKDNKKLFYKIMYSEGKWKKETLIDIEVLSFDIYIDENEQLHLVYSNTKGQLKYCTIKDNEWLGKTIYLVEKNSVEIKNIKIKMINNEMNIFYLLVENDGSDHSILVHGRWSGKQIRFNNIQDIILIPDLKEHYSIKVNDNYEIDLFFLTDEGDEVSLNYQSFKNYIWSPKNRLYGIQGGDIGFEVVNYKDDFYILNKSKEDEIYSLDYVFLDSTGKIEESRIYDSKNKLEYPMLTIQDKKLICSWIEKNKVFYSIYDGENWSESIYFNRNNELELELNNVFYYADKEDIQENKFYVTKGLDLYIFSPKDFFIKYKSIRRGNKSSFESMATSEESEVINNFNFELSILKAENKNLTNKNSFLNKKVENSQRIIKEYDEKIADILNKKLEIESKYDELIKKENKEKESMAKDLVEEKRRTEETENSLKKFLKEKKILEDEYKSLGERFSNLSDQNNKLKLDLDDISKKNNKLDIENLRLKEENIVINEIALKLDVDNIELDKRNRKIIEDNQKLIKEKEILIYEKDVLVEEKEVLIEEKMTLIQEKLRLIKEIEKLKEELEIERNQSVMDRLLRRRINL